MYGDEVETDPNLGAVSNIVVKLSQVIPYPLVVYLAQRDLQAVATFRRNRILNNKEDKTIASKPRSYNEEFIALKRWSSSI